MCFWCGAKINGVKSSSSLSQTNNTGIMSGMLTTRALLWGLQILYRLVVYSFMQVVVLGFNLFHVNLPRSLCIIKKKKSCLIWVDNTEISSYWVTCRSSPLILHDVILAVFSWVAKEAQGAKNSKSSGPAALERPLQHGRQICTLNVSIPHS